MARANFTTPAHVEAIVYRTLPANPVLEEEPLIQVFGELDVAFTNTRGNHDPIYFKANVQVGPEGSLTVVSFSPLFGQISGAALSFLDLYKELFQDCLFRQRRLLGFR